LENKYIKKIWWVFARKLTGVILVLAFILTPTLNLVINLLPASIWTKIILEFIANWGIVFVASYYCFKWTLVTQFPGFRIEIFRTSEKTIDPE